MKTRKKYKEISVKNEMNKLTKSHLKKIKGGDGPVTAKDKDFD